MPKMMLYKGIEIPDKLVDRFWNRVDIRGQNVCWEWQAGRNSKKPKYNYGLFWIPGLGGVLTHRLAFTFSNGREPKHGEVIHSCDNPPCCNPKHLFDATHEQNMKDRYQKGRYNTAERGVKRHNAKLNDEKVREIRRLLQIHQSYLEKIERLKREAKRTTKDAIAKIFGVDRAIILMIQRGQAWKHVRDLE